MGISPVHHENFDWSQMTERKPICSANRFEGWMDIDGISPIHHENFDWSTLTIANNPAKYAKKVGDVWYKRGAGWGLSENQPLTRFSLYADMIAQSDREEIPNTKRRVCKTFKKGKCEAYTDEPEYDYIPRAQYTSLAGLRRGAAGPL